MKVSPEAFAAIAAVEGLVLTDEQKRRVYGPGTVEERRQQIIEYYRGLALGLMTVVNVAPALGQGGSKPRG